MSQPDATQLHPFIVDHFSLDELKTLCFNLGVEFDDLGGDTRQGKARELVKAMQRQTRLDHLAAHLSLARPDAYRQRFHESPAIPPTPARLRRNPRQVFVSHAHQDAAFARRLAGDLRQRGFPIWIAPDSIRIGEDWPDAIDRGLDESGVIVVALTPNALNSYWVRKEASTARLLAGRNLIQFALLDVTDCEAPSSWYTYQNVPFRHSYEAGLDELLRWLEHETVATGQRSAFTPNDQPIDPLRFVPRPIVNIGEGVGESPDSLAEEVDDLDEAIRRVEDLLKLATHSTGRIHAKTGIELIRIPAGPFLYGSADSDKMAWDDEKPQRTVELPEYWIGRTPVTNDQFARFVRATGHKTTAEREGSGFAWTGSRWEGVKGADWLHPGGPSTSSSGKGNHPVVQVSWDDAQAFCNWAGLALPVEEQWEKAARGADGRVWPWGNEPPAAEHCNFNMNIKDTTPVGKYSPRGDSPYGCADMAGNVWEWTGSWYTEGSTRALRGGSWLNNDRITRAAFRLINNPDLRYFDVGFRVVELLSDPGF